MPLGFVCIRLQLDLEMKKTIFNMYFSYPFRRTLPRKQLDPHQCQWLDMLCRLECERKKVISLAFQQRLITAKFLDSSTPNINNTIFTLHCQVFN